MTGAPRSTPDPDHRPTSAAPAMPDAVAATRELERLAAAYPAFHLTRYRWHDLTELRAALAHDATQPDRTSTPDDDA